MVTVHVGRERERHRTTGHGLGDMRVQEAWVTDNEAEREMEKEIKQVREKQEIKDQKLTLGTFSAATR